MGQRFYERHYPGQVKQKGRTIVADKYTDLYPPITEDALSRIPAAMKADVRWVCWGGKKIPVNGNARNHNGYYIGADITDPEAWLPFNKAAELIGSSCCVRGEYFHVAGIGFVVGDGWFCIDADGGQDHGREPVPESVITDLCNRSGTYAELSISKNGCHVFGQCGFETQDKKEHYSESRSSYEIEFFTRRKFIIVTGNHVPGSAEDAILCNDEAYDLYDDYVLSGCNAREEEERKQRESYKASITINPDDAEQFFLLNYPEILEYANVDHFKRGGKGGTLQPGEYSWIGAIKAMDEIGVPRSSIYDWCRRGASFAGEKDIDRVLNEKKSSQRKSSAASIVTDAIENGWKPDPERLTGEYKKTYELWQQRKENKKQISEELCIHQANPEAVKPVANNKPHLTVSGYDDVEIKPIDFLFFPWFPRGYITAVQGDSGSSKSTFMYAVGARVTTGEDLIEGVPCEDPGNVMFITIEDDASDIKVSFQDAGGDLSKLRRIQEREEIAKLNLEPEGIAALDGIIKKYNIRMLVLDPIQQFISGDINKASETRPQMARLMNVAAENNISIVVIEHMGKDTSKSALHRAIGSVDVNASTRSLLQVVTDPEDDFYKIMFTVKSNLAAHHDIQRAIRYQVKDHPGSYDTVKQKRQRFRGHAELVEMIPEYNERAYRKAMRKSDEAAEEEILLAFEYGKDPLVLTARELVAENPQGLFIGTDDFIQRITQVCGQCPYDQSKSKATGIYNRVNKLRSLMIDSDGIQIDTQSNSIYPKAYNWRSALIEPAHIKTKGFRIVSVRANKEGYQQTKM